MHLFCALSGVIGAADAGNDGTKACGRAPPDRGNAPGHPSGAARGVTRDEDRDAQAGTLHARSYPRTIHYTGEPMKPVASEVVPAREGGAMSFRPAAGFLA